MRRVHKSVINDYRTTCISFLGTPFPLSKFPLEITPVPVPSDPCPRVLSRTPPISPFHRRKRACCRLVAGIFQTISACRDGLKPGNFPALIACKITQRHFPSEASNERECIHTNQRARSRVQLCVAAQPRAFTRAE